jgi:hypothetical protein
MLPRSQGVVIRPAILDLWLIGNDRDEFPDLGCATCEAGRTPQI